MDIKDSFKQIKTFIGSWKILMDFSRFNVYEGFFQTDQDLYWFMKDSDGFISIHLRILRLLIDCPYARDASS